MRNISQLTIQDIVSLAKDLCDQLFCTESTSASETCHIDLHSLKKLKVLSLFQLFYEVCGEGKPENS
jgi:hypothetical protein